MPINPSVNLETAIVGNENNNNNKTASAAFFNAIMFARLQRGGVKVPQKPSPVKIGNKVP
jgi:hypothetical protein